MGHSRRLDLVRGSWQVRGVDYVINNGLVGAQSHFLCWVLHSRTNVDENLANDEDD